MKHKEAFCLMWYGCACGHRERFWNSRDGVTPFCTLCPSCNRPDLTHVWFNRDEPAPTHKPAHGQCVWIDMTRERASQLARERIALHPDLVGKPGLFERLVENLLGTEHGGGAPDLQVTGYQP